MFEMEPRTAAERYLKDRLTDLDYVRAYDRALADLRKAQADGQARKPATP